MCADESVRVRYASLENRGSRLALNWRLRGRDGTLLARGVTQGGSLEPSSFAFQVEYSITGRQIGALEVYEPRVTNEGFPPSRNVVPLVLAP